MVPGMQSASKVVSLLPHDNGDGQDLKKAFELFNQMSQQLVDSYQLLENSVADQRLQELAEKEQIANRL